MTSAFYPASHSPLEEDQKDAWSGARRKKEAGSGAGTASVEVGAAISRIMRTKKTRKLRGWDTVVGLADVVQGSVPRSGKQLQSGKHTDHQLPPAPQRQQQRQQSVGHSHHNDVDDDLPPQLIGGHRLSHQPRINRKKYKSTQVNALGGQYYRSTSPAGKKKEAPPSDGKQRYVLVKSNDADNKNDLANRGMATIGGDTGEEIAPISSLMQKDLVDRAKVAAGNSSTLEFPASRSQTPATITTSQRHQQHRSSGSSGHEAGQTGGAGGAVSGHVRGMSKYNFLLHKLVSERNRLVEQLCDIVDERRKEIIAFKEIAVHSPRAYRQLTNGLPMEVMSGRDDSAVVPPSLLLLQRLERLMMCIRQVTLPIVEIYCRALPRDKRQDGEYMQQPHVVAWRSYVAQMCNDVFDVLAMEVDDIELEETEEERQQREKVEKDAATGSFDEDGDEVASGPEKSLEGSGSADAGSNSNAGGSPAHSPHSSPTHKEQHASYSDIPLASMSKRNVSTPLAPQGRPMSPPRRRIPAGGSLLKAVGFDLRHNLLLHPYLCVKKSSNDGELVEEPESNTSPNAKSPSGDRRYVVKPQVVAESSATTSTDGDIDDGLELSGGRTFTLSTSDITTDVEQRMFAAFAALEGIPL